MILSPDSPGATSPTVPCCLLAEPLSAEQIAAAPIAWIVRDDPVIEITCLAHQVIDFFLAQEAIARDHDSLGAQLGFIVGAVGVTNLKRWSRIAGQATFPLCPREWDKGAIPSSGRPGKPYSLGAGVEARVSAKRHQHFGQFHAPLVQTIGIGSRHQRLERLACYGRHNVGDAFRNESRAQVEARRTQIGVWQAEAGNPWECGLIGDNRNQRAILDTRVGARWRLIAVGYPAVECQYQCTQHAVMVEWVDTIAEHAAITLIADIVLSAGDQVDARFGRWRQIAQSRRIGADQRGRAIPVLARIVHIEQLRHRAELTGTIEYGRFGAGDRIALGDRCKGEGVGWINVVLKHAVVPCRHGKAIVKTALAPAGDVDERSE